MLNIYRMPYLLYDLSIACHLKIFMPEFIVTFFFFFFNISCLSFLPELCPYSWCFFVLAVGVSWHCAVVGVWDSCHLACVDLPVNRGHHSLSRPGVVSVSIPSVLLRHLPSPQQWFFFSNCTTRCWCRDQWRSTALPAWRDIRQVRLLFIETFFGACWNNS